VLTLEPQKTSFHSDYVDLGDVASKHNVPLYHIKNINDPKTIALVRSLKPDIIFVFGWSQIIKREILELPSIACIGTHPALLPRNRGRHPLIWALVEGLKESGLTFFYLDEGADSGDILWQKSFPIALEDDAGSLYEKIKDLASEAIREFLPQLKQQTAPRMPQNHDLASYWGKRGEKDGEIQWSDSTLTAFNLIRALTHPYVGAHTFWDGERVLIWKAQIPEGQIQADVVNLPPGSVFQVRDFGFDVRTGDGYLTIIDSEIPVGRKIDTYTRLGV
jgi:methionyl-tRNA formyltransferase